MKQILSAILFFCFLFAFSQSVAQCNGDTSLCNRKYHQVAYLTTHNAFNCDDDGFLFPNQNHNLTKQLNNGVRAFMLDVYNQNGIPTVYHGLSILGTKPLVYELNQVKNFLDSNQNEIITLILECNISSVMFENSLITAGLTSYLYTKLPSDDWLTLQEMIDQNKRLVILSDINDALPGQEWYHYVWSHAVETNYSYADSSEFSCDYNRGYEENDLFILNHFITGITGFGSEAEATIVNSYSCLANRALSCMNIHNKFPNFITVDFYEKGDALAVVNMLNNLNWSGFYDYSKDNSFVNIFPNPTSDCFTLQCPDVNLGLFPAEIVIYSIGGNEIQRNILNKPAQQFWLSPEIANGFYLVEIRNLLGRRLIKLNVYR